MLKKIIYSLCVLTACSSQLRSMEENNITVEQLSSFTQKAIQHVNDKFPNALDNIVYCTKNPLCIYGYEISNGDKILFTPSSMKVFQDKDIDLSKRTMRHFIYLSFPKKDFWDILEENQEIKHLAIYCSTDIYNKETVPSASLSSAKRGLDTFIIDMVTKKKVLALWKSIDKNFDHIRYTHIEHVSLQKHIANEFEGMVLKKKENFDRKAIDIESVRVEYYPLWNLFLEKLSVSGIDSLIIDDVNIQLNSFFSEFNFNQYRTESKFHADCIRMHVNFFNFFSVQKEDQKQENIIFVPNMFNPESEDNDQIAQDYSKIMQEKSATFQDIFPINLEQYNGVSQDKAVFFGPNNQNFIDHRAAIIAKLNSQPKN